MLIRRDFKESNEAFIPTGPWLVGSVGGGVYPNKPKTMYFTLMGQSAKKNFLDENTPINVSLSLSLSLSLSVLLSGLEILLMDNIKFSNGLYLKSFLFFSPFSSFCWACRVFNMFCNCL